MKRERGTGSKYQKRGLWWIKVHDHGKVHRESTGLRGKAGEKKADALLKRYAAAISEGTFETPHAPLEFEELAAMLEADYVANERKSLDRALRSIQHLRGHFKGMKALDIPPKVGEYIVERKAKAKPATVQLELAALKRMFNLAYRTGRLAQSPYIASIQVRNTRQGFFEEKELLAVLKHLKPHLRPVVEFAYLTGWRKAEILCLTWRQVDFQAQTIRLEPGTTKNDEGRTLPFSKFPTLAALLTAQRDHTKALERATAEIIPSVFHRAGKPILDFREAWEKACDKAKVSGRLFHDLRRTAVRNLERAGVPRSVATRITGHKTESVYRRYAIVCEADLAEAGGKLEHAAMERSARLKANES